MYSIQFEQNRLYEPRSRHRHVRLLLACALALCLLIGATASDVPRAWAQTTPSEIATVMAEGPETEPCSSCHSAETTAWQESLHAAEIMNDAGMSQPGASCIDCHGEYVRGHPDAGLMPLMIDSSNCATCHADTYGQWQNSQHAAEGVQCISCHSAHDEDLRLTDETLCRSCHHEAVADSLHTAHWQGDVACTSCHLTDAPNMQSIASTDPLFAAGLAPTHDFVTVSAAMCLDCHRNDVTMAKSATLPVAAVQVAQPTPELASKLASVEASNHFLTMLSTVNLGFGIGIGGILGMIFVFVVATISKRNDKA